MIRLQITLGENEAEALSRIAYLERREPRDQAVILIRQALVELNLLQPMFLPNEAQPMKEAQHDPA